MRKIKEKNIRRMIEDTGLSVRAWAMKHGFLQGTLSSWITGVRNISNNNLIRLANELHVDISEISEVVFKADPKDFNSLEQDRREICGIFGNLHKDQRRKVINLADKMSDANRAEEELEIEEIKDNYK